MVVTSSSNLGLPPCLSVGWRSVIGPGPSTPLDVSRTIVIDACDIEAGRISAPLTGTTSTNCEMGSRDPSTRPMAMALMHRLGVVGRPGKPEGAGRFRAVQSAVSRMPSLVAERVDGEPMESDEVIHFDTASGVATGQGIDEPLIPDRKSTRLN